eukprot:g43080.t1
MEIPSAQKNVTSSVSSIGLISDQNLLVILKTLELVSATLAVVKFKRVKQERQDATLAFVINQNSEVRKQDARSTKHTYPRGNRKDALTFRIECMPGTR